MSAVEGWIETGNADPRWSKILADRFTTGGSHVRQVEINQEIEALLTDPDCEIFGYKAEQDEINEAWRDYWNCKTHSEVAEVLSRWLLKRLV